MAQPLDAAPAHLEGQVFQLGNGLILVNGLVVSWIPVEQHRDGFGVELGPAGGQLADLAFYQGQGKWWMNSSCKRWASLAMPAPVWSLLPLRNLIFFSVPLLHGFR